MASNAEYCLSMEEWKEKFLGWILSPSPQALLGANIMFDFRSLFGDFAGSSSTTMSPADVASLTFWANAAPLAQSASAAAPAMRRRETNDCIGDSGR